MCVFLSFPFFLLEQSCGFGSKVLEFSSDIMVLLLVLAIEFFKRAIFLSVLLI
jgi:hypothetical protein